MGLAGINHIYSGILELETGDMPLYLDFDTVSPEVSNNTGLYHSVNFAKFYQDQDKSLISNKYAEIIPLNFGDHPEVDNFTGNGNSGNFAHGSLQKILLF